MTGRIKDLSVDRHGKAILMLEINERSAAETLYDELNQCEKCEITVKKYRKYVYSKLLRQVERSLVTSKN